MAAATEEHGIASENASIQVFDDLVDTLVFYSVLNSLVCGL